jgi:hypothetical protein
LAAELHCSGSMQTFLPLDSFLRSAKVLDFRRLGKQRVEARQILNTLLYDSAWRNHPAVKMWAGYELALMEYENVMIEEWVSRGYRNTMELMPVKIPFELPPWFGDPAFHASHRSNLLRKDFEWYSQFGWVEPDDLPYVWPKEAA